MGISAGLVGLGGSLAGMFGGNQASNVHLPPQFNMPNMGGAAENAFQGIGGLQPFTNAAQGALPYAQNTFQSLYNNPYAGQFQQGAGTAGQLGTNAALGSFGAGAQTAGAGLGLFPGAQAVMQSGFDPQNALYNRTLQQVTDQTRSGLEARGLDNTPYGAGVEGQTLGNFNIDWQNNLLGREATAAGAAGGLVGQGAGAVNMGTGIMNQAPGQYLSSAAMPYATAMGIGGGQNQATSSMLGLAGQGQGIANAPIQDYFGYLGAGNQAGGVANQQAGVGLQQQNQGFQQQQMYGNALGRSLYGLGQGFGNYQNTGSFGTGAPMMNWAFG